MPGTQLTRRSILRHSASAALFAAGAAARAQTVPFAVIKDSEANLPDAAPAAPEDDTETRDLFRPPDIDQVSPPPNAATGSVFPLQIKFKAYQGATIDPSTVKVTYMKTPLVDLTQRLKSYITSTGISVPAAEFPRGFHVIQISVADTDHNTNGKVITLIVR